jgi:hypothetical protein
VLLSACAVVAYGQTAPAKSSTSKAPAATPAPKPVPSSAAASQASGTGSAKTAAPVSAVTVEQALRARATQYLQATQAGNFSKAYELVAPDSKDYFLTQAKTKPMEVKIERIEIAKNGRVATVTSLQKRVITLGMIQEKVDQSISDEWKLVSGRWYWSHNPDNDVFMTPMGPSAVKPNSVKMGDNISLPKEATPEAISVAAESIMAKKPGVDKEQLEIALGIASDMEVRFENPQNGAVKLVAEIIGRPMELTVDQQDQLVPANGSGIVKVSYRPVGDGDLKLPGRLRLTVEPFGIQFNVQIVQKQP